MTENEAKAIIKRLIGISPSERIVRAVNMATEALEEIQQYRAIGTVDEIEPYVRLAEKLNLCDLVRENARLENKIRFLEIYEKELKQYKEIGTVEECREAMERQRAKKCTIIEPCKSVTYYQCPCCNGLLHINENFCGECGQAIDWSE